MSYLTNSSFRQQTFALVVNLWQRYRWRLCALTLLMGAVALTEGLGMALLLPLLNALGVAGLVEGGVLTRFLSQFLGLFSANPSLLQVALIVLLIFALQLILFIAQSWWVSWLQRDYGACWQRRLFDACIHAEWGFFTEQKLGNLTNLIAQESIRLAGALLILAQLAAMVLAAVVYVAVAFSIAWQMTLMMIALALVLFIAVRGIGRKNYRIGLRLVPLAAQLNVLLTEYFGGIKLIKATATEDEAVNRVAHVIDELRVQHTWATFLPSLVKAIFEFCAIAALCFILAFGYRYLALPAASMLVVIALFVRLLPRFNALQQNLQLLATYVPAYGASQGMLAIAESRSERKRNIMPANTEPQVLEGALSIDIARGGYRDITALFDVAVTLPEKGLVGIVGESGAGKSTLTNCLLGLADIAEGTVHFGEVDMRDVPLAAWRKQVGYVPQETVLFHLSIRDNIAWGRPDATDEEIAEAAEQALAHEFIMEQPNGYTTQIGDAGMRLSGGQRQRLGIARALLAKPRLLVMDEATSALDSASEAAVLETVNYLRQEICVVMVAHRLSTVRNTDLILVLKEGRLVESGDWSSLLGKRGAFHALASAQHVAE